MASVCMSSISCPKMAVSMPTRNVSKPALCARSAIASGNDSVSFNGLRMADSVESSFGSVSNGSNVYMMRHRKKGSKLGRPADQRKALLRGLTTEVLRNGRITTTQAKAKAVRPYVEKMITLAKGGSLHERRQALAFVYDKDLVAALFEGVPERYADKNGGYTRILQTLSRRGDNAPMSIIELVD